MMLAIHGLINRCIEMDLELSDPDKGEKENSEVRKKEVCVFSCPNPFPWCSCKVRMLSVCLLKPKQVEPQLGKDVAVMSGLLEIVVVLWKTVTSSLQKNKEAQKYIFEKFGSVMPTYFKFFTVRPPVARPRHCC